MSLAAFLAREYEALLPLVRWLNRALGFQTCSRGEASGDSDGSRLCGLS